MTQRVGGDEAEKIGYRQIVKGLEFGPYFSDKGECEVKKSEEDSWRDKHEEMALTNGFQWISIF